MSERNPSQDDNLLSHDYDGIEEYDNPLPRWWVNIFWATFAFSVVYLLYYHFGGPGLSPDAQYAVEMKEYNAWQAELAMAGGAVDEGTLSTLMNDSGLVSQGQAAFTAKCASCHGESGEGKIGPNLTDSYWLHGASLMEIYHTVDAGVLEKGMPAWGRAMRPDELKTVVAYVGTLRGKNQPGKGPEGKKIDSLAQLPE